MRTEASSQPTDEPKRAQDEGVRAGLKELSNWPTYPQLYVRGELLGGCDIVLEMKEAGELKGTVQEMLHRMDVA